MVNISPTIFLRYSVYVLFNVHICDFQNKSKEKQQKLGAQHFQIKTAIISYVYIIVFWPCQLMKVKLWHNTEHICNYL